MKRRFFLKQTAQSVQTNGRHRSRSAAAGSTNAADTKVFLGAFALSVRQPAQFTANSVALREHGVKSKR